MNLRAFALEITSKGFMFFTNLYIPFTVMKLFASFLFFVCLCFCAENILGESTEAAMLLMGAFQNSGNNPKLFQTGKAEFEIFRASEGDQTMKRVRESAYASQQEDIKKRFSSDPQKLKKLLDDLQSQFVQDEKTTVKQQEHISVLFSGTDNTFSRDRPDKCKRRVVSRLFLATPNNNEQVNSFERHFISKGVLNQKDSALTVESVPKSQKANIENDFQNKCEFQTFGRIWDIGGSEVGKIFRKKLERKTFTLPSDFISFFVKELETLKLTCEVTNEVSYDSDSKAKVVIVKDGQKIIEQYHIDPSRGYICPYIRVVARSGWLSVECIAKDYLPVGKNNLFYPSEYTYTTETKSTGTSTVVYKLLKGTLEFNQLVSDKEFALDFSEGTKILDYRSSTALNGSAISISSPAPIIYYAVANGTLSLSTDFSNLSKLSWIVREENLKDYVPPHGGASGYVRWLFMGCGIVLILLAIYKKWKN